MDFSATLANLLSIATQLPAMAPSSSITVHTSGPDFRTLGPSLLTSIADIQTAGAGVAAAAVPLAALNGIAARIQDIISPTPTGGLSDSQAFNVFIGVTIAALKVAAVVAAQNLVASLNANNCIPTVQALSDFQQAYHVLNVGVVVSGVYDSATAAAVGTTLGEVPPACATPVNPVSTPLPPAPPPPPPPATTTTAPAAASSSATLYTVIGVAAAGIIGFTAYTMAKNAKKRAR